MPSDGVLHSGSPLDGASPNVWEEERYGYLHHQDVLERELREGSGGSPFCTAGGAWQLQDCPEKDWNSHRAGNRAARKQSTTGLHKRHVDSFFSSSSFPAFIARQDLVIRTLEETHTRASANALIQLLTMAMPGGCCAYLA